MHMRLPLGYITLYHEDDTFCKHHGTAGAELEGMGITAQSRETAGRIVPGHLGGKIIEGHLTGGN
jgi:hypothetical protein